MALIPAPGNDAPSSDRPYQAKPSTPYGWPLARHTEQTGTPCISSILGPHPAAKPTPLPGRPCCSSPRASSRGQGCCRWSGTRPLARGTHGPKGNRPCRPRHRSPLDADLTEVSVQAPARQATVVPHGGPSRLAPLGQMGVAHLLSKAAFTRKELPWEHVAGQGRVAVRRPAKSAASPMPATVEQND